MAGRTQISGTELQRLLDLVRDADSVELKLTLPERCSSRDRRRLGRRCSTRRCGRSSSSTPQTSHSTAPRSSFGPGVGRARRPIRSSSSARSCPPSFPKTPSFQDLQRRGGRDAWRVRVLRVVQRLGGQRRDPGGCRRHALDPQALLEGAASVLFRPRTRRTRARPALRARADPDAQAEDQAEGIRAPARRGVVAVSGRLQIVELSTKAPSDAFQVAAEARAFLTGIGVDLEGKQQTKTKTALEFFAGAA